MPQNFFGQLKMSKKLGGSQRPPNAQLGNSRAEVGDPQFSDFLSVDMSVLCNA